MAYVELVEIGLEVSITETSVYSRIIEDSLSIDICEGDTTGQLCSDSRAVSIVEEHINVNLVHDQLKLNYVDIQEQHLDVTITPNNLDVCIVEVVDLYGLSAVGNTGNIFVYDVTNAGIIADKIYDPTTVPSNVDLQSCITDTNEVTLHFFCEGAGKKYSPIILAKGVTCTDLAQHTNDRRNFYGTITIQVTETEDVVLSSNTGQSTTITITRADAGPEILTCLIGSYPGSQTAVKAGDTLNISGTVETAATEVRLIAAGGFVASSWQPVVAGNFSFTGTVNSASGNQTCTVEARNSIGTIGTQFDSTNSVILDQLSPVIGSMVVDYPGANSAFKNSETGTVTTSVSDFTSLLYSSPHGDFSISNDTTYENVKNITCTNPGDYNDSEINFQITANKSSNATQTVATTVIEVADTNPVITISQPQARLRSAPLGEDHTITATSDQNFDGSSLDVDAPVGGTWQGSWVGSGKIWTRDLRVLDADDKGSGLFSFNVVPTNNAGLQASITGTQVNGGFVPRDLVLQAFNNEISVAVAVVDYTKVQMGLWEFTGATLTRSGTINDTPPVPGYFTIDQQGSSPHTFRNLDTNQTNASSQATMIYDYEEVV